MSFMDEIRKVPPVTRFLCASFVAVTLPVLMTAVPGWRLVWLWEPFRYKYEIWRPFTSLVFGSRGIAVIFEFVMLYRNSDDLESRNYILRSADYAWQLFFASIGIIVINVPLKTLVHTRAFLLMLTYLSSKLAPAGTLTSFFGLFTFPVVYLPYMLIGIDFLNGGPEAAAVSISGAIIGHLWWWGVWDTGALREWGTAPRWLLWLLPPPRVARVDTGVHVTGPQRVREEAARATGPRGHDWGSGRRLGS